MEELKKTESAYRVVKNEEGYVIESDDKFSFEADAIAWDERSKHFIITFKRYVQTEKYYVEYVLFTENFEIDGVYRETLGVNPAFIIAPDQEIWVDLSATALQPYPQQLGSVIVPLFNRSRVADPVVKRDTGMDYFFLDGKTYSYVRDNWGQGKDTKLVLHKFDKEHMYKDRKAKKLTNVKGGTITSVGKKAFLYYDGLYEISPKLDLTQIGEFKEEKKVLSYLIDKDDETASFIRRDEGWRSVSLVKYKNDGTVLEKKTIYKSENEINSVNVSSQADGSQMISFPADGVIKVMGYKDGKFCAYDSPYGTKIKMFRYGFFLVGGLSREAACVRIVII